MKLPINLHLIILCSLFFNGCGESSSNSLESIEVNGANVSLNNKNCSLTINKKELGKTNMKPACYFVRNSASGEIDMKYYKDIDTHVLLVVGTISPKDKEYPLTLKRDDCGTQIQALLIKGKEAILSKVSSNTLICAGVGTDEKMFYILSHS